MTAPRTLHGREDALGALRTALEGAVAGRGQVLIISGEAGIGKSALAAALAREAEVSRIAVTWGRAWEFADAPPYFPLWQALRDLGIEPLAEGEQHDATSAFRLWERVAAALANARAPALWVVEDLHAADLGTLDLLAFLGQAVRGLALLVVGTVRSGDPRLSERAEQRLTRLGRDGLVIRLAPLADLDVAAVVEESLGRAVPASTLRHLVELTGGNPLFVTECARTLRDGPGNAVLGALPSTVRQIVLERVAHLPDATRKALAAGAVLGREFAAALVAHMSDALPARVIDAVLPALRAGVVSENKPGSFVFEHALVRDAIEDALAPGERAELHARAEAALSTRGDALEVLVERTRHALAALPAGDALHALALARRTRTLLAADGAFDRAYEIEARLVELEAAALLPALGADELLDAAATARAAGRSDACRRLCERVLTSARARGDGPCFARAALLHAADVRPGVIDRAQVTLFEDALRLLGAEDTKLRARLLARLATALQPTLHPAEPFRIMREALAVARATQDAAVTLDVLDLAGWGLYQAPLAERSALARELFTQAFEANDLPRVISACRFLAQYALEAGDYDGFAAEIERALVFSGEAGHPRHRWQVLLLAAGRAAAHGLFGEAERYLTEVRALSALTDDPALPMALTTHEAFFARMAGREDELPARLEALARAVAVAWQPELLTSLLNATSYARCGDTSRTRLELDAIRVHHATFEDSPELLALLAEAVALAGSDDERQRVRNALVHSGRRECFNFLAYSYEGTLARLLGLLAAALGELTSAEGFLREALELARSRRQRAWVAQLAYELGGVLARLGRERESRVLVDECVELARELPMPALARRANAGEPAARADSAALELELVGEVWSVVFGVHRANVKDSRGMQLLARLVARPGEEIHVLALASDDGQSATESDAGELIDERALRAYRQRLSTLDSEIEKANATGEGATGLAGPQRESRVEALSRERDAVELELRRALGLGGRSRRAGSTTERARVSVQKRVKEALARISEASPDLGRFLSNSVRTGTFCVFSP
jgi:tetratricopeptide (TPR) repeat protein